MAFKLVGHGPPGTTPATFPLGQRKQYPTALRQAVRDLLGADVARVEVFNGGRLVAVCGRERVKDKWLVRCSGEKPSKAARERATRALKAARERARRHR